MVGSNIACPICPDASLTPTIKRSAAQVGHFGSSQRDRATMSTIAPVPVWGDSLPTCRAVLDIGGLAYMK